MNSEIFVIAILLAIFVVIAVHAYISNRNFKRSEISKINLIKILREKTCENRETIK